MGFNYTLQGRKKISQCIGDIDAIIKEFIGMQPRPLFINPDYTRFDETGFIYTEPYIDDYQKLDYSANEKNRVFIKIECEIEGLVKDIDNILKSDLVQEDNECKDDLHWFYHKRVMDLDNIAVAADSIIYKRHLMSLFELQKDIYPQAENDDYLYLGNLIEQPGNPGVPTSIDQTLPNNHNISVADLSNVPFFEKGKSIDKKFPDTGFESYLNEPDLIKKLSPYKNLKNPKKITLMVFALKELGKLNCDPSYSGTALHRVLETSFGFVGVRASISGNLKIYRNTPLSNDRKIEINEEKQTIINLISSN
jgi:hypothetical protein